MEDKLHHFFSENDFDVHEPHSGHFDRFEKRLQGTKPQRKFSWGWMSVAASILLLVGFGLGNYTGKQENKLSSISPKMAEVETYFVSSLQVALVEVEKSRSLDTEKIIEHALEKIEELEDTYQGFVKEFENGGDQQRIINAMINNYQQRLDVLKSLSNQIEELKKQKNLEDEIYI